MDDSDDFTLMLPQVAAGAVSVQLADGTVMPESMTVQVVWQDRLVTFSLRAVTSLESDGSVGASLDLESVLIVESVTIRDGNGLAPSVLSQIPFTRVLDKIRTTYLYRAADSSDHAPIQHRKRRARTSRTPLALATVADVYSKAIEGNVDAFGAVAEHLGMSRSTAAQWVWQARRDGYLPPTTPGRKAGGLTGKARQVLDGSTEGDD